jgi:hypothetical protein
MQGGPRTACVFAMNMLSELIVLMLGADVFVDDIR